MGWLFVAIGIFSICGAIFEWNFFMNHRKAQFLINLVGKTATRVFYGALGILLTIMGSLMALGIIPHAK
ncbi:MAG: Imm17 family immunity protein [Candidatus Ozemobacteraceae bacterium]